MEQRRIGSNKRLMKRSVSLEAFDIIQITDSFRVLFIKKQPINSKTVVGWILINYII